MFVFWANKSNKASDIFWGEVLAQIAKLHEINQWLVVFYLLDGLSQTFIGNQDPNSFQACKIFLSRRWGFKCFFDFTPIFWGNDPI